MSQEPIMKVTQVVGQKPVYEELTAEELAARDAAMTESATLEAEQDAERTKRQQMIDYLTTYDFAAARDAADASTWPDNLKRMMKDVLFHIQYLHYLNTKE